MSDPAGPSSSPPETTDELAVRRQQKAAARSKIVKPQASQALPPFARPAANRHGKLGEAASALGRRMVLREAEHLKRPPPAPRYPIPAATPAKTRQRGKENPFEKLAGEARYTTLSNRFSIIADLNASERAIAERLDHATRRIHQAGADLAGEGEIAPSPMFIVSGWACRMRVTASGRRQILGFLLPGDAVCLRGPAEHISAFTVCALTTVETVDAAAFLKMASQSQTYPGIALAVEGAKLQDDLFTANQIVRLGTQTRTERVANLLLELRWRLQQTGLADGSTFPMPLTRETLADALGMKASRINLELGWLRARNMLSLRYQRGEVLSSAVESLAGFKAPEARFSAPRGPGSISTAS